MNGSLIFVPAELGRATRRDGNTHGKGLRFAAAGNAGSRESQADNSSDQAEQSN